MRLATAAIICLAMPAGSALAQDCEAPGTQAEMNACAGIAYEEADAALNAAYAEVRARLDEAGREQLVATQRAWIAFRDADCAAVGAGWMGGTGMGAAVSNCLADATRARTKVLQSRTREGG